MGRGAERRGGTHRDPHVGRWCGGCGAGRIDTPLTRARAVCISLGAVKLGAHGAAVVVQCSEDSEDGETEPASTKPLERRCRASIFVTAVCALGGHCDESRRDGESERRGPEGSSGRSERAERSVARPRRVAFPMRRVTNLTPSAATLTAPVCGHADRVSRRSSVKSARRSADRDR